MEQLQPRSQGSLLSILTAGYEARERRVGQRTWERGWEQLLRRSIIILEENCGNVDDIYLVILRFQCNKQDMGVLHVISETHNGFLVISNRELSY